MKNLSILLLINFCLINQGDNNNVELMPKLGPVLGYQNRNVNSSLQVFCGVQQGSQPLFFEWFKNGQPIKPGPGVKFEFENSKKFSTLNIERIDKEDAGNYSCLVKNVYGSDSIHVSLTVKGILSFVLPRYQCMALSIP